MVWCLFVGKAVMLVWYENSVTVEHDLCCGGDGSEVAEFGQLNQLV